MKISKKVTAGKNTVNMTASARVAELVQPYVEKKEATSTIKISNKLIGLKSGDSYLTFIQDLAQQNSRGTNGSFSIKVPVSKIADEETQKKLATAVGQLHGHLSFILDQALAKLPEEEKAKGKKIQEQNYIRNKLLEKVPSGTVDKSAAVETVLAKSGEVYIPDCAQLELKITGGQTSFEEQDEKYGWKHKNIGSDAAPIMAWVKNSEIFGRKRVPLVGQETIAWALTEVFATAKSFEDQMGAVSLNDIIPKFCEWTDSLSNKDYEVKRVEELNEDDRNRLDQKAAELALKYFM
jgi:hypothetical protein